MRLSLKDQLELACLGEATARKPGNVHPLASFISTTYEDFVRSAAAVSGPLSEARSLGVGPAILRAARETWREVGQNTNLGIILLLAPLAACDPEVPLAMGIRTVLDSLTSHDAEAVYEAIRLANPGGLGRTNQADVANSPPLSLLDAMRLAADRDTIAEQYVNRFSLVLAEADRWHRESSQFNDAAMRDFEAWELHVIGLQLSLMSRVPDSLIARKLGQEVAQESARRAQQVQDFGWPKTATGWESLQSFDAWLRADGNRRNPGTTADLIAAILFCVIRTESTQLPTKAEILEFAKTCRIRNRP